MSNNTNIFFRYVYYSLNLHDRSFSPEIFMIDSFPPNHPLLVSSSSRLPVTCLHGLYVFPV